MRSAGFSVVGRRGTPTILAGALIALAGQGCHQYLDPRLYAPRNPSLSSLAEGPLLEVRALGVQGFAIRVGDVAVLTPPLYSNPDLSRVISGSRPLTVREDQIEAHLQPDWLEGVVAALVGHSHYDHLMDLPYIYSRFGISTPVYGSRTATSLLRKLGVAAVDLTRVVEGGGTRDYVDYRSCKQQPKEGCVFKSGHEGAWLFPDAGGGRVRFRALCSRHSSQIAGLEVSSPGCHDEPPPQVPRSANEWRLGDTYAYLIEFVDPPYSAEAIFRIYYQDSPTDPEYGYLPAQLGVAEVDVALLCAGAFDQVRDNPSGIIGNLRPRFVLFGHWENFFERFDTELHTLFSINLEALRDRVEATRSKQALAWEGSFWFAVPGTLYQFQRRESRSAADSATAPGVAGHH